MFAKFLTSGFVLFLIFSSFISYQNAEAQVFQDWVRTYNGPSNRTDEATSIASDKYGNVYVTGYSYGSGTDYDIVTIKYNSSGEEVWTNRFNGTDNMNDFGYSIAVDGSGNVYVAGYSVGISSSSDFVTIKFNSAGNIVWVRKYNGTGNHYDQAKSISVDNSGNVYVTGYSYGTGTYSDFVTIKYNSAGVSEWISIFNGADNRWDEPVALVIDDNGNVYVTGYSGSISTSTDYATIKYSSTGDEIWVKKYNGIGNSYDNANSIAIDGSGNVYVTGRSSTGGPYDYATIKYNSSGEELWIRTYNGPGNYDDEAFSIGVDNSGNVYVTGRSWNFSTFYDYATVKYNTDGTLEWERIYNGTINGTDEARSLAIDKYGNVYVTGNSNCDHYGTYGDYTTIKYNSLGIQEWIQIYNSPDNQTDKVNAIAVNSGNVCITGQSRNFGSSYDYTTIKYSQIQDPAEITALIVNTIDSMQTAGILSEGNANSLRTKLNDAIKKINEGQFNTAINNLNAFTNEVQALINSGRLTPLQGNALIDRANAIIEQLSGDRSPTLTEEPKEYKLHNNYPNPFNPVTSIRYDITETSDVKLVVYNTLGQEIDVLINKTQQAGSYIVEWHASNYPSGVYFYKLTAGKFTDIKKMVLLK